MSDPPLTRYLISGTDVRIWNDDDPAKFKAQIPIANEQWVKWAEVEPLQRELEELRAQLEACHASQKLARP